MAARLTKRFGQHAPTVCALLLLAASLGSYSVVTTLSGLLLATTTLAISCGLVQTLLSSAISQLVQLDEVGGAMGISAAIGSLSRVVAPPAGGQFTERFGVGQHAALAAVLVTCALLLAPFNSKIDVAAKASPPPKPTVAKKDIKKEEVTKETKKAAKKQASSASPPKSRGKATVQTSPRQVKRTK